MTRKTVRKKRTVKQYEEDLQFFLMYGDHPFSREPFRAKQNGGGTVRVGDQTIVYKQNRMGDRIVIQSDRPISAGQFILFLDGKTAIIHSVSKVITPLQTENTKDLVRAAVQIATNRKASWIEVTDNSTICKEGGKVGTAVSLADYSFVTKGKTWYETIFPFEILYNKNFLDNNRKKIQTKSWKDVISYTHDSFYMNQIQEMLHQYPIDTTGIDINAPGSIMSVLQKIPKDIRCRLFQQYMSSLLYVIGLKSLDKEEWYYPLKKGVVHPNIVMQQTETKYTVEKNDSPKRDPNPFPQHPQTSIPNTLL